MMIQNQCVCECDKQKKLRMKTVDNYNDDVDDKPDEHTQLALYVSV